MKKSLFAILFLLAQSVMAQAQLPSYVPQNGLSAWWGLNGNANDMSSNNNNATYNGTTKDTLYINSVNSSMNNTYFRCVITNGSCSDTTSPAKLMLPNSVSTYDAGKWNIYPNPTKGHVFIEAIEENTAPFHLRIYTINGALLRAYSYPPHTSTITISLQGLDAGIYLLEIETKNTVFRNKIIHY